MPEGLYLREGPEKVAKLRGCQPPVKSHSYTLDLLVRHEALYYTQLGHELGFGPARKLPGIVDLKSPHINNMGRLKIDDPRGFGAVQIPSC